MRLIIGGSAHHAYQDLVRFELTKLHGSRRITVLIHGGLGGVCVAAEKWSRQAGVPVVRYPPNWVRYGKAAEVLRNSFMVHDARPDLVVAFPGGPHTRDLIRCALREQVAVYEVPERDVPPSTRLDRTNDTPSPEVPSRHMRRYATVRSA